MMEKIGFRRKLLFTLMTLVASTVFLLFAAEMMVRLSVSEETFWPVSNIYQLSDVPGIGYTYRPGFDGVAFGVDLKTNRFGFRGHEWTLEKESGVVRVALIGDSYAFGYGVPSKQGVAEVLRERLEDRYGVPVEVLNFGVNGYNTFQQSAILQNWALDFTPDMVVLLPVANDHKESFRADSKGWLHWDGNRDNDHSRVMDSSISEIEPEEVSWWMEKSRLFHYLKLVDRRRQFGQKAQVRRELSQEDPDAYEEWMGPVALGPLSERLQERVHGPLMEMIDAVEERDLPLVVAFMGDHVDFLQMFLRFEQEMGIPVVLLLKLFPEAKSWLEVTDQFGLGWNDHLNAVAHHRFAVAIDEKIAERELFPKVGEN